MTLLYNFIVITFLANICFAQSNSGTEFALPSSEFTSPKSAVPKAQKDHIVFPYFMGETTWMSPSGILSLFTKYNFPNTTRFRVQDSKDKINPQRHYRAFIESIPNKKHFESIKGQEFFISGEELLTQKKDDSGVYSVENNATFFQSTPVFDHESQAKARAEDPDCDDAAEDSGKPPKGIEKLELARLVKDQLLESGEVPPKALTNAWNYFESNFSKISNQRHLTVIDYNLPSDKQRLFLIDLKTGEVNKHLVSHGVNSSGTGSLSKYAVKYSNTPESFTSSHGAFLTAETYHGKFDYSLKLDGQQAGINDNVRSRYIVAHPWNVYDYSTVKEAQDTLGCFGLDPDSSQRIIDKTKGGSLWFVEPYRG